MIIRRAIMLVAILGLTACGVQPAGSPPAASTPPLVLPALDGSRTIDLASLRGSVVLVNFWASWCEPCTREMPRLQQWQTQYADQGLVVLGVATLYQDQRPAIETFVQETGISYPVVVDETGDISRSWLVQGLPITYVIDRDGVVRARHAGEFQDADFAAQVEPLLGRS